MSDLVALLNGLVDENAHILIPGIYEQVMKLAPDEETLYETIDFDLVVLLVIKSSLRPIYAFEGLELISGPLSNPSHQFGSKTVLQTCRFWEKPNTMRK